MATYNRTDKWPELWDISEKLANLADPNEDCLSALCSLSKEGTWETSDDGKLVYKAPVEVDESAQITETGVLPIESYTAGDSSIPTRVARKLGLGEYVVCKNAGYILQGESIIDRAVYRATAEHGEGRDFNPTTLSEMLQEDSEDDIYWTSLEWRHLQSVVDDSGGQACRFEVLASILKCLAQPGMDSETFVPYGHQFADSDFVDSI